MFGKKKIGGMEMIEKQDTIKSPVIEKIPGITSEQYVPGIQVRGGNESWSEVLIFSRASSLGTGTQSFTGFSFTPTSYSIRACHDGFNMEILQSEGAYQKDGTRYGRWIQGIWSSTSWPSTASSTFVTRVINNAGTSKTAMKHSSFVSGWIEFDFSDSDFDVILEITAYK